MVALSQAIQFDVGANRHGENKPCHERVAFQNALRVVFCVFKEIFRVAAQIDYLPSRFSVEKTVRVEWSCRSLKAVKIQVKHDAFSRARQSERVVEMTEAYMRRKEDSVFEDALEEIGC